MNRFAAPVLVLVLLAVLAVAPFAYRANEVRRRFAAFQGDWDVVPGSKPFDLTRVTVRGADVTAERRGFPSYIWRLTNLDAERGWVDVLLVVGGRVVEGPGLGFYKADGDHLLLVFDDRSRPFLWNGTVAVDRKGYGKAAPPLPIEPSIMLHLARRGATASGLAPPP
jgi:hypothetical protein